jgi:hypothetical protein
MVNIVNRGGRRHLPPAPAWADFTPMVECTIESGHCHSVFSAVIDLPATSIVQSNLLCYHVINYYHDCYIDLSPEIYIMSLYVCKYSQALAGWSSRNTSTSCGNRREEVTSDNPVRRSKKLLPGQQISYSVKASLPRLERNNGDCAIFLHGGHYALPWAQL